jgi:fatty-acyl-CoA synthase
VGLKPGCAATAEELVAWCRERLAHFKCPKIVEFGPLPRTATGKIRKNELRARTRPDNREDNRQGNPQP